MGVGVEPWDCCRGVGGASGKTMPVSLRGAELGGLGFNGLGRCVVAACVAVCC